MSAEDPRPGAAPGPGPAGNAAGDPFAPAAHPGLTWTAAVCGALALMLVAADLGPRGFFMGSSI